MRFYSHWEPEKISLQKHLRYVGNRSKKIIESKVFNNMDGDVLSDVSYLIGISHDFGKYTSFFQEKIKGLRDREDPLTYHGLISALFIFEILSEYMETKKLTNNMPYKFLPLIGYFIVKHHHGNLKDIESDTNERELFEQFKHISKQIQDIENNKNQIKKDYSKLFEDYNLSIDKIFERLEKYKKRIEHSEDIKPIIGEIKRQYYFFSKDKEKEILYYLLTLLLYSVLIDSDKKHAGRIKEIERRELPETIVENYLNSPDFKKENRSSINRIRNEIRKTVLKNIRNHKNINQRVFTLTAPTGTGKTLTSFSAALLLRKKIKKEMGLKYGPRIIYSLPFTSIIDQNFDVFDKVLSRIKDFKENESVYLLKHHYLSDIFYKTKDINKEKDIDKSLALIESWESEVIVTTFIQLFYTLIGYKNRSLKKFHNIVNSVIILDEVQNIPIEYWSLIREVLVNIAKYFNCIVILMTATKPLIFEEGDYKELVDNYEGYFKGEELNRIRLKIDPERRKIMEFCNNLDNLSKNSYLFVFNTISSSLEFYKLISRRVKGLGQTFKICYLSTSIIPKERKQRIKKIRKAINRGEKVIVVSTQLIEAGVDIDCDCVYRDIGPLDSVIQVAGRCNRNKRFEKADMYLLNLVKENDHSFTRIYDSDLIKITKNIFKNKEEVTEKEFLELINEYFREAKNRSCREKKLIDALYKLYFYDKEFDESKRKPISEFKLIKDQPYKVDVFIELDEKAQEVWQKYQEIINNDKLNGFEKKNEFLKIKRRFYDYVISVDKRKINPAILENENIGYIPKEDIEKYYDKETGFKRDSESSPWII